MSRFIALSVSEQVAEHLKAELVDGAWSGTMPGEGLLMKRLGIGRATVRAALKHLEDEGLLAFQGHGQGRRIVVPETTTNIKVPKLRVRILLYEKKDWERAMYIEIRQRLQAAGHMVEYAEKDLHDLGMDPERVARFVQRHPADAWVVSAASKGVLEWFAAQSIPAFALYGNKSGIPIAGASPLKSPALVIALNRLVELGHRRIVLLEREDRRKDGPGAFERSYLAALASNGIKPGPYNLPDWEDTPEGFRSCLDKLFEVTPPTALILCEPRLFLAAERHLAQQGILAPRDVSMICDDPNPAFDWCHPSTSYIAWSPRSIVRRVLRWVENVAHGQDDRRQTLCKAKFIEGGTIGPAPRNHEVGESINWEDRSDGG